VTSSGFSDSYPSWSRDGSHIVFCSNRANSTFDLFTVKADGTGLTGVTSSTAYNEYAPAYSDDGSKISYILQDDAQGKGGLYTIRADAGTSGAQPVLVKSMQDGGVFTYWTSLTGRSLGRGESVPYHFRKR
jgi:Tol biopolymer transport system component